MALTHATATRNSICAAVVTAMGSNSKVKIKTAGNAVLVIPNIPSWNSPSGGAVTASPQAAVVTATGTAAKFDVTDSSGTVIFSGTVGTSGADLNLDSVALVLNQVVALGTLTYTAPA